MKSSLKSGAVEDATREMQPDIIEDKDQTISEILSLRQVVEELHDQREEDRQSIRILQSQIDSMRDAKCSDSFDQTLQNLRATAVSLWNSVPWVSLDALIRGLKRKKRRVLKGLAPSETASKKVSSDRSTYHKTGSKSRDAGFPGRSIARDS